MPQHAEEALVTSKKRKKRDWFQSLMLVVAVVEPSTTLPQIYEIWVKHQAAGVSVLTWSLFVLVAVFWLFYGLKIKDKPVLIASCLWVIMELAVVFGVIFN
jgi:uncharacterized protein with PQ loop repeat